jgi:hypothetical protein
MKKVLLAFYTVVAAALLLPQLAQAQVSMWEINAHGGAYFTDKLDVDLDIEDGDVTANDENDTDVLLGARLGWIHASGFGIGGNFDWILANQIAVDLPGPDNDRDDIDISLFLYSAEINYQFPSSSRAKFFVGAGYGGASITRNDWPDELGDDSSTEPLIPLSVGLKFVDEPVYPRWGFRVDLRDNIIQHETVNELGLDPLSRDEEWQNNIELSGGVSFFFGGAPRYVEPEVEPIMDSDNDGVLDDRDQCPNTPIGTRVDSTGCPVPLDSDNDGVLDDSDRCPNTPAGTQVDSSGCPIVVEPAPAACVDGRDWYRSDEPVSAEGGSWIKFGTSRTLTADQLMQVGEYDGVPVYVRTGATQPYSEIYLPLCAPANTYQTYRPAQAVRGTTG